MELDLKRLPHHVAIIMDGNGRWARQRVRNRIFGHRKGAENVRGILTCCNELGIRYLTLYAFSEENWNRPNREVRALWELLERFLKSELPELVKNRVRVRHIGDDTGIPASILARTSGRGETRRPILTASPSAWRSTTGAGRRSPGRPGSLPATSQTAVLNRPALPRTLLTLSLRPADSPTPIWS